MNKYELLCNDAKRYVDRYARSMGKSVEQAMQDAIVKEVIMCYQNGELDKPSDFGFR